MTKNALGKKNSNQCFRLRNAVLMPIVSAFCMQAWAADETVFTLESASGETKVIAESGTYTASEDLTFGALQVAASNVTFDFSEYAARKIVFDGTSGVPFIVAQSDTEIIFKGGEWVGSGNNYDSFYCGYKSSANNINVLLDGCIWTNLNRVYVGHYAYGCKLTLDNCSRAYASDCFLMRRESANGAALNVLGGSGLYLSDIETPFRSDNDAGNDSSQITVSGEGSILSAPYGQFRFGYKTSNHYLAVSNGASLVANKFIVGVNASATGSQVLIADGATLTAADISIRNLGCCMTVSNATLEVDSTAADAIKVGYEGRNGGTFVLSGASAQIDYAPEGNVEVFAPGSGNAEFRIENGASWNVTANQIAAQTSNSVFRITSGGKFIVGESTKMHFGPAASDPVNPATSLSNRLEVCDGGSLVVKGLRFSGHGNMLVVSNGCMSSTDTIQIGYTRPDWKKEGWGSTNCMLVVQGRTGQLNAPDNVLQVQNGSVVKFVIPEDGYETGIVPLKLAALSFDSDSNAKLEIDCEAFMAKGGGKVTLATVGKGGFENAETAFAAFKETLPQGYDLTWENSTLVFRCPRNRFVFSIR